MGNTCKPMAVSFQCMTKFTALLFFSNFWSGFISPWFAMHFSVYFYECIVDLQCCVSFRCRAKWFGYIYFVYRFLFTFLSFIGVEFPVLLRNIEKHQQPPICIWYYSNGRKQRRTEEPLDVGEGWEWNSQLETKY